MTEKETPELKEDYSKFSYQWIKGDLLSNVQHYQDIIEEGDKRYIVFTDNSRILLDLLDEYMIRVDKGFEEVPTFANEVTVSPDEVLSQKGVKTRESRQEQKAVIQDSPIFSLLSKQKENWVDVDLQLSINLPPKSLWDVLVSSFDDAEKDILEYVTKDLDIEVVRQSLRNSIKDIYKKQKNIPTKNVRTQDSSPE